MKTSRHRSSFLSRRRRSTSHLKVSPPDHRCLRFEVLEDRRVLAMLIVDSALDNMIFNDGMVTLREAIFAANTDTVTDSGLSGSGADTIEFSAALDGQTIALGGTELQITEELTIDATSLLLGVTINATLQSRIFNITATTGDFALAGLTLNDGVSTGIGGGAVRSTTTGNLDFYESTVSGNSTIGNNAGGGGIFSYGSVTLTNSTVSGNNTMGDSAGGGGIFSSGSITLNNSTVSGNSTMGDSADGGGIRSSSTVMLTSSTVTGNRTEGSYAYGGGIRSSGDVTLTSSTVTDNQAIYPNTTGGGIWNFGGTTITITNSIVAGNTDGSGVSPELPGLGTTLIVNFSLIGDNAGTMLVEAQTPNANGNLIGSAAGAGAIDPLLDLLAHNGGPTETLALLVGSPAINAGDPGFITPPDFDQRDIGFPRVNFGRIDMGAYESQVIIPAQGLVVDTATDIFDNDFTIGNLALREAVFFANLDPFANTITFAASLSSQTITLGSGELEITEEVAIDATSLAQNVTIDANNASRIFNITATAGDFTIAGLTLTGGQTTGNNTFPNFDGPFSGGAIRSLTVDSLTIDQSTITGNSTTGDFATGGGIFSFGDVTLTSSIVSGNSTAGSGALGGGISSGGINSYSSTVTLTNSTVSGNSATADGGGIFSFDAVTLNSSTVSGNSTASNGGGIFSSSAVTLTQSTVSGNSATGSAAFGAGIRSGGAVTLTSSTVTDNRANAAAFSTGGGIWNDNGPIVITNSIVAGNVASSGRPDIDPGIGTFSVNYSLIGTGISPDAGTSGNNVVTNSPVLGALTNNGGPTETHALLAGSPAIDAGDPNFTPPPNRDQRGFAYQRVVGGRIDIGAFELGATSADFDTDDDVDGADFLAWQRGFGTTNAVKGDGDADNDADVDAADLVIWTSQFGQTAPLVAAASASATPPAAAMSTVLAVPQSLEEPENIASSITTSSFPMNMLFQLGGFGQSLALFSSPTSSDGFLDGSMEREKDKVFHDLPDRRSSFSSDLLNSDQTDVAVQALATAEAESQAHDETVDHAFEQLTDDALTAHSLV